MAPFAFAYGLVYWGEQYIPSGLAAVLFGMLPLYVGVMAAFLLPDAPLRPRLIAGILIALGGLALTFAESLELGDEDLALAGAVALPCPRWGRRPGTSRSSAERTLDPVVLNGWGMLGGGLLLLAPRAGRALERFRLDGGGPRIDRLPGPDRLRDPVRRAHHPASPHQRAGHVLPGDAAALRGAAVRAALYDEAITWRALAGAGLVAAGLLDRPCGRPRVETVGARSPRSVPSPPRLHAARVGGPIPQAANLVGEYQLAGLTPVGLEFLDLQVGAGEGEVHAGRRFSD